MNPVPYGEDLALNVSEDESAISFDLAIETAQYYGITQKEAEKIVDDIWNGRFFLFMIVLDLLYAILVFPSGYGGIPLNIHE